MAATGFVAGLLVECRMQRVQAQAMAGAAFPAVPGQKGGEDIAGPYEPVVDWPQPLTFLPTEYVRKFCYGSDDQYIMPTVRGPRHASKGAPDNVGHAIGRMFE